MKTLMFSSQSYEQPLFEAAASQQEQEIVFHSSRLDITTSALAKGYDAVCAFVNDDLSAPVLEQLAKLEVNCIALRCAGFNQVDLAAASQLNIKVVRVPAYSPEAVAEYTIAMILTLNRKIHKAWNRVREGNFGLGGLQGFNLHGRTAGLIGLGQIGHATANILNGFGMRVLGFDPGIAPEQAQTLGVEPVSLDELYQHADIVSLHCPLNQATYHLINEQSLKLMKPGAMLINTSRGSLIDTQAVIQTLKSGHLGALGIDVYEQEGDLFFRDLSESVIQDDTFQRLLTFPNVVVTGHQGFFTREALTAIAQTTVNNLVELERTGQCINRISAERIA